MHSVHPNARTTPAVRAEIARSSEPSGVLAQRYSVSTETIRKWRKRGPDACQDRSARPHKLPWKASEERAIVCALRRSTGFPLDDLTFVVTHFLPHLNRDAVYRILKAEGLNRLPAQSRPRKPHGAFKEYDLGFVHLDIKHLPKLRDRQGVTRKRFLFVAIDRCSRWVHLAVKEDETAASAVAFLKEAVQAFPFQITHVLTDRGSCFTADGFEAACRKVTVQHRTTRPYTPKTNGMVERFNGRVQREVLGITIHSHTNLEVLLRGFSRAYNARRQRVLGGISPDEAVRQRMKANPKLASTHYQPPSDPCVLPKALLVVAAAKEVSHPDSYLNFTTWPSVAIPPAAVRRDFGSTDPGLLSAAMTFCHLYGRKSWRSGKDNVLNNFVDIVRGSAFGGHYMGICIVSSPQFQALSLRIPRSKLKAIAKVLRHFDSDGVSVQQTDTGYVFSDSRYTLHIEGAGYWDSPCGLPLRTHVPIDRVEVDREAFSQALRIALIVPGGGERIGRLALREEGGELKLVIEHYHRGSPVTTATGCMRDEAFRDNPPRPWQIDVDLADLHRVIRFGPSSPVRLEMTDLGDLLIERAWGEVTGRAYLAPLRPQPAPASPVAKA